jgi:Cu/Ag efflux pump CusA
VDELLSGVKAQLAIKLFGPELDVLSAKGHEIETLARTVQGTRDVAMEAIAGEAQLVIRPDRDLLSRYGISVGQIMAIVSDAIGGREAGQVIRGNERSVGQALLIMLNVPLALIGGVGALFLSGQYLSVPGSIGFIALFGVAVLNGVVMVNAINQLLEGGQNLDQAVFEGALSRLRPVLMTASIAALGLIPMLLATGVGAEVQRPLATVVVGGLFSSTILTLFVLPALYPVFSKSRMV